MIYVAQQDFSTGPEEARVNYQQGAEFELYENAESTQNLVDAGTIIAKDLVNAPETTVAGAGSVDEAGIVSQKPFGVTIEWAPNASEDEVAGAQEFIKHLVEGVNDEAAEVPSAIASITIKRL